MRLLSPLLVSFRLALLQSNNSHFQIAAAYSPSTITWRQGMNPNSNPSHADKCSPERNWGVLEPVLLPTKNPNQQQLFRLFLKDNGTFPNNPEHPVIVAVDAFRGTPQEAVQLITEKGEWTSPWQWGIFTYHHYHSTAWELLLCIQGQATIQLGGNNNGAKLTVKKGDLMLIPPGVVHKQLNEEGGFSLLGSYPTRGCSGSVDTLKGKPTEQQRQNIAKCIAPTRSPILEMDLTQFYF